MSDLDEAERLGVARAEVDGERAGIFQAVGRYDDAFAIRNAAVELRRDFETQGALALSTPSGAKRPPLRPSSTRAGPFTGPSRRSRSRRWISSVAGCGWSRRTSPALDFWFGEACCRLPAYAPAQGHLSEVEAALGEHESALVRLAPLTVSSDDPDYAAQFARILAEIDRTEEARTWLARAAAAYDALVSAPSGGLR